MLSECTTYGPDGLLAEKTQGCFVSLSHCSVGKPTIQTAKCAAKSSDFGRTAHLSVRSACCQCFCASNYLRRLENKSKLFISQVSKKQLQRRCWSATFVAQSQKTITEKVLVCHACGSVSKNNYREGAGLPRLWLIFCFLSLCGCFLLLCCFMIQERFSVALDFFRQEQQKKTSRPVSQYFPEGIRILSFLRAMPNYASVRFPFAHLPATFYFCYTSNRPPSPPCFFPTEHLGPPAPSTIAITVPSTSAGLGTPSSFSPAFISILQHASL